VTTPSRRTHVVDDVEAVRAVESGMTVAVGSPPPMALLRQLVRRGVRGLTVIDSGLSLDLLIAAGAVKKVMAYYAGGGFGVPVAPAYRRAVERGDVEVWECEEGILTAGLQAAAQLLPFFPWRGGVGTSLPEVNRDLRVFQDPIRGETLLAVPPIRPDVTLLHAARSDAYGNVQHVGGPGWLDLFLHRAADRTIVTVERVVAVEETRRDPWATTIPSADMIVHAPWGAHPFASRGFYLQDDAHVRAYLDAATASDAGALARFVDEYCRTPAAHTEYLERIGLSRLLGLAER